MVGPAETAAARAVMRMVEKCIAVAGGWRLEVILKS
jgi:hypothetical protein